MSTNDSKLFSSIKYFTTGFRDPSLETKFKQNGAIRSFYLTETTTHVICDDFDSNRSELEQAIEIYQTPIVSSDWIQACLKCNTLLPIDPYRNTDHLFRSCTFANANLSTEDHNKIYALVTYYGGHWITNIDDSNCTHIICASSLSIIHSGDETMNNHRNMNERLQMAYEIQSEKIHLITPDWIIDCLNGNRLLEETDYHPDLLKDPNEPMDIDEDELDDEQNTSINNNNQSTDEQTPTKTGTHRSQLITKNFFNQSDQTTPPPSAEPVAGINDGSNPPDSSDTSQTKNFPPKRSRTRTTTTTTPRQRNTKLNSTLNSNLHSNQNGHSSIIKDGNLSTLPIEEKLIRPSISSNLLLNKTNSQISRHPPFETLSYELNYCLQDKHELIPTSQCLIGCIIYIHENEYLTIVTNEDLLSWSKILIDYGAILTNDINNNNLTHFISAYRTSELFRIVCRRGNIRMVTAYWLNDVLQRKKLFVPNLAIHYPSPFDPNQPDKLPLNKYYLTMTGFQGIERSRLRYMIRLLGGKYSGHLTKWHTHLLARENGKTNKYKKGFQWSIPIVNGLWLSELYLGNTCALKQPLEERYKRLISIDHFSFDQIFVHDLLLPWSQSIRINDEILNLSIRRHNEQQQQSQNIEINNNSIKNSFHYKQPMIESSLINNQSYSIMLTGFNKKNLNFYENIIQSLGGEISTIPHKTTHLIMNRFLRTEKLYECINYVKYVLNKNWLDKCNQEKCFVFIEELDWINNEDFQSKQSIDKRIYRNNQLLFNGYSFFLTPSVQPSELILKSIIYSTGGYIYRQFPTKKTFLNFNDKTNIRNCFILSCDSDKFLFKDLYKYNNTDIQIQILSIDFLLQSILQQEILNIDSFILKI